MKTLYRHILVSYLGPMFLAIFIVDFIFLVQFVWLQIDELVGKGLPFDKILELMWWVAVWNISMGLPLATLFA